MSDTKKNFRETFLSALWMHFFQPLVFFPNLSKTSPQTSEINWKLSLSRQCFPLFSSGHFEDRYCNPQKNDKNAMFWEKLSPFCFSRLAYRGKRIWGPCRPIFLKSPNKFTLESHKKLKTPVFLNPCFFTKFFLVACRMLIWQPFRNCFTRS